ncbi:MAG TPA: response regulator [Polyangiaceae bacterium]|jgi:CheY-like chemotaxis protein|nr:response regulator [Polyangiaceae bacterium]
MNDPPPAAAEPCVLVVDDEADTRDTLRELIEMAGCSALMAANGVEALALLDAHHPCMIILDLMMPVMGGKEMLDALQARPNLAALPVLISTSSPERAPPGLPVLAKPIDIDALWDWMRRACKCASGAPATN